MASKRAASTATGAAAKRAKPDPVLAKIQEVVSALESIDAADFEMLSAVIPHCLGIVKEERHRFQQEAVEAIEAELKKVETGLEQAIETAKVAQEASVEKVAENKTEQAKVQEGLDVQREELKKLKSALAADARVYQKAKTTRSERLSQQELSLADASQAEASKAKVEAMVKELDEVHKSTEVNASAKFIKELSKQVDIDDSMKTAIPSAIAKSPESRGGFDAMVVQQLNGTITKRLEELAAKIASAEPTKAALAADVAAAETDFQAAKAKQMAAAKAFAEQQDAVNAEEAKLKALQKEMVALKRQDKKFVDGASDAQSNLDLFRDGPLAAFAFLKERAAAKADEQMTEAAAAAPTDAVVTETPAVAAC